MTQTSCVDRHVILGLLVVSQYVIINELIFISINNYNYQVCSWTTHLNLDRNMHNQHERLIFFSFVIPTTRVCGELRSPTGVHHLII